jgi:hypothetical protein
MVPSGYEPGVYSVRDYGALGDGTTDDTAAIQAAIDAAIAGGGSVSLPSGTYLVTALTSGDTSASGLHITGAGKDKTILKCAGDGPILSLGVYDSTPSTAWCGTGNKFHIYGVGFRNYDHDAIANVGVDQHTVGIQDNGSGGLRLRDCSFTGLSYGIYAPYGHDYCRYYDVDFVLCTTSVYFGPGSQQIYMYGCSSTLHDRAIVIEGAKQGGIYGFVFTEPRTRDVDFLSPDTLESGVTGLGVPQELAWSLNDCWFETGSGWNTGWAPTEHIRVGNSADTTSVVRGISINNTCLVSGSTGQGEKDGGVTYAFLNASRGKFISIREFLVSGDWIEAIVTSPASSYYRITVDGQKTVDGYTAIPVFDTWQVGNRYFDQMRDTGQVTYGTAAPTTLTWRVGDIRWNTGAAAEGYVGWVCTAAGTPGTWKGFGVIES